MGYNNLSGVSDTKIKMLSLFSGIGSPEQALKNIGIDFELVGFSEIDKFAIKSYCAIHEVDDNSNLGDITKIDISKIPNDIDLITHGSPCQDFSVAGKGKGGGKGTGTRSSLMWNTVDIVEKCKPKYVLWENVKNLLSKKHKHNFDGYIKTMECLGYNNYYKVLNAKDYGVPQNRERVFTLSIRKDIDKGVFKFPDPFDDEIKLKDILDKDVEDIYIISNEKTEKIISEYKGNKEDLNLTSSDRHGFLIADYRYDKGLRIRKTGICPCLLARSSLGGTPLIIYKNKYKFKIRKLTPEESWRFMGFKGEQFRRAAAVCSNTQLYKQAGNSIVVNVLEEIFKKIF